LTRCPARPKAGRKVSRREALAGESQGATRGEVQIPMKARVTVTLKPGILDPQGKAIEGALNSLGIAGVASVRQGKVFDIEIKGKDRKKAEAALKQAADKLLANTVIENYDVEMLR
jgi:phosphoribosylformylglycinamidine synthase